MEAAQEEAAILSSMENTTHIVIKGKRTKRQRPQSPIPFPTITTNSPSIDTDGEGRCGGGGHDCDGGDHQNNDIVNDNMTSFSPTTSANQILHESIDEEEEEDMANCLILLAQGQSRESPKHVEEDHADGGGGGAHKSNSRRFLEATATGTGKAGYYVYECKTCYRTFPSFQALGGHRASHKKPKAAISAFEKPSKQFLLSSDEDEAQFKKNDHLSSLSFQSSSRGLCGNNRSNKVHECSICGAEFTSGQALGGHMRRHRTPITGNKFNTTLTLTPPSMAPLEPDQEPKKPRRTVLSLNLDLNLPAPDHDDHREPKFPFATKQQHHQQQQQQKQQQPPLVFTPRTLVDCHY